MLYNEAYIVIENNDHGVMVCHGMHMEKEYENLHMTSAVKSNGIGIEMNRRTKKMGCSGFKDMLESSKLEIFDEETIKEISTFERKADSFAASDDNHDDIVMNLVMFGYFATTVEFEQMTDINLKKLMFNRRIKEIEKDVPPFGFMNDGIDDVDLIEDELFDKRSGWSIVEDHTDW